MQQSIPSFTAACYQHILKDLEAGFTTLRDAGCRYYADVAVRDAIARGDLPGPRLWVCGQGITSTSGHMDREKGLPPHLRLDELSTVADGPVEARRAVRLNLRYNVDFIKINATISEHVRRYSGYCAPEMTKETMAALFEEAHWHGRKVTAHCHGGPGVTWAIEAGIDGIEHGNFISDEQLQLMAGKGIAFCPTLSVQGHMREDMASGIPTGVPYFDAWREKAVARAWDNARRAHEFGVMLICGTDASWPGCRHGGNAFELEMMVEAGLSPMEAIVAATGNSAKGINLPDVGTVAPGKFADLVFVDGNPLEDIRMLQDTKRIPVVIKGGQVVVKRDEQGRNLLPRSSLANLVLT